MTKNSIKTKTEDTKDKNMMLKLQKILKSKVIIKDSRFNKLVNQKKTQACKNEILNLSNSISSNLYKYVNFWCFLFKKI